MAGRARTARATPWVLVGGGVAALGLAGAAIAAPLLTGPGSGSAATLTPTASPSPSPTPRVTATASPKASPSPTPTPPSTPVPATPAPTPVPTPVVTPPPQTYAVAEGDTLAAIAQQFGTSVSALQQANGIEDPDEIVVGQVLVIP